MDTHANDQLKTDSKKLLNDIHNLSVDVRSRLKDAKKELAAEWARLDPLVMDAEKKYATANEASKLGLQELLMSVKHLRDSMK